MILLTAAAALVLAAAPAAPRAAPETDCGLVADTGALLRRGFELYDRDRYAAARACFDRALALAQGAQRPGDEAEARRGRGRTLFREGRLDDSARELEQARALFESVGDRQGAARVDSHLGSLAVSRGDRAGARELYERARRVFEDGGADGDRAHVLYNLLFVAPDAAERERIVQTGLPLARNAGDRILEGRYLSASGDLATDAGDYALATERYRSARALYEAAGARLALGRLLASMSRLHLAHGDPVESLALARAALRVQEEIGDAPGAAQTLNLLGTVSSRLGRHRAAVQYFGRALESARRRGDTPVIKLLSVRLAEAHLAAGATVRAGQLLDEALRPPVDPEVEPGAWEVRARVELARGRDDAALQAAERAVELARTGRKPLFAPLQTRAQARRRLGRYDEALADAREAVGVVEAMRARLVPSDFLKQGFGERHQALFGMAIDLLTRLGRDAEALETAEQARARAFLDLLAGRDVLPARPAPGESAARPLDSPAHAAALSSAEVAATARRFDTHVLSYWVNEDATFVWVTAPGGELHAKRVGVRASRLAALVGATVSAPDVWRQGGAPETAAWRELHRLLIEPVTGWLPRTPGALVTVVPHGALFRLSFAALRDGRGVYLIERHALNYVPAVAVLQLADRPREEPARAARYLLVGDPSALPASPGGAPLPRLPAARREVQDIRRLLAGEDVTVLTGEKAGEAAVRAALPGRTVIHLATHGVVRDDAPLRSFVALGSDGASAAGDGRLTVDEIYALPLDASLVFLSACRSGRGKVTGDGILGLTRGFLSAGASSLVATLWDVPDAPAAALVPAFYRTLHDTGQRSGALRSAQLDLLRRLRRGQLKVKAATGDVALPENPLLWAGFILVGEP